MNLSKHTQWEVMSGRSSAATKTSSAINLGTADGCLFLVGLSTTFQTSTGITCYITGSTALAGTYKKYGPSLEVTSTTTAISGHNKMLFGLDLYKPMKQFAKVVVAGGSSGTVYLNHITAIRYGLRNPASTATPGGSTTVAGTVLLVSPTSS